MKTTNCSKCGFSFANKGGNFNRHFQSCNGSYLPPTKLKACKYCSLDFNLLTNSKRANHCRWCKENPKSNQYKANLLKARQSKKSSENQYTKARKEGREIPIGAWKGKPGHFTGRQHTEKSKQLQREKALMSSHRRLKKGTVRYKDVVLDSSWELELAKRLDQLKIQWTRPKPIPWKDADGHTHNYFPDFYLPAFDLFLDPKNPFAVKVQESKLKIITAQYNNIVVLTSLEECKNFNINS